MRDLRVIKNEKGMQSILVATVMIPLLFMILAFMVQVDVIAKANQAVQEASFEAVRAGVISDMPVDTAVDTAYNWCGGALPGWSKGDRVDVTASLVGSGSDQELAVNVAYSVPVFVEVLFKDSGTEIIKVNGVSKMRIEEKF
ncbi:hypothetical protein [Candidatus Oleimmundimicrobium sp.]|uniref:hypothetical protein n=1 Tax=Candidatus Oleimmundimicrobium sp. TaxID=3060597 RepID=UPI002718F566|nr:hypothetical protein [Candidatus Oleimmundimicrobium sp.]MDO8886674.1 hypothetical protein [Candidatus Oleimmundimicrobium sp.]